MMEERTARFLEYISPAGDRELEELEKKARSEGIPLVRPQTRSLLGALLHMNKPSSILEIGTAVGYSALFMGRNTPPDTHIITIEKYEKRIPEARANFERLDREKKIELIEGDALQVLDELAGSGRSFDLIFMDAAKGQYLRFFDPVMELLSPGGVLLSDNVLREGDILESRYALTRRDRTIHTRMRDYLRILMSDERLVTSILPIEDGVALSVRRQ